MAGDGLVLALLLILVIRPVAVWLSTLFCGFSRRERVLLGWAGLRGAVPIVLATFAVSARVADGNTIFNTVFFIVVISTILQGTTLERFASALGLLVPAPPIGAAPIEVNAVSELELMEFAVTPEDAIAGGVVRELGLPRTAIVAVVAGQRGDPATRKHRR